MCLDRPYQNWGKTVDSTFQTDSCNQHLYFKEVSSDSAIMEITMEITVFQLFDNLTLNIAYKCWWI